MTALPLVHPWGNRLGRWGYRAAGRRVDLRGLDLPVDDNGLPIHGNLLGAAFGITRLEAGRLRAEFDYGASTDRLRAFPFPHRVAVDARLDERGLRLTTEVEPTADRCGTDLVLLAPVPPHARRRAAGLGGALAEVRAHRGRRAHHPDRRPHAAGRRTRTDRPRARSMTTTRSAATARSRSRPPGARSASPSTGTTRSASSTCPRAATSWRSSR